MSVLFGRRVLGDSRARSTPAMMTRYLLSCGLRVVGGMDPCPGGWWSTTVLNDDSGEAAGRRWVRALPAGGYDVRKERP